MISTKATKRGKVTQVLLPLPKLVISTKATQSGNVTQVLLPLPKVVISEEVTLVAFIRKNSASRKIVSGKKYCVTNGRR